MRDMNIDDLAGAIEARRDELGWTQRDLSEQSGVSLTTISAIERRARDGFQTTTLNALDRALGWTIGTSHALLRGDEIPSPSADRPNTSTALQALYSIIDRLNDDQIRVLLAKAQSLAAHAPETFQIAGTMRNLSLMETEPNRILSLGLIETTEGEHWSLAQITIRHSEFDRRIGTGALTGDEIAVTLQRID